MVLIIAEKPSLARNIAAAIGEVRAKRDGYLECDGYLVSWAFGHLFSLCDIEAYQPSADGRWRMDNLPCFPKEFRFELRRGTDKKTDSGVLKQFRILETLCNRPDVDTIVNAGDADREGEIIVRLCVQNALHTPKPQKRLWLPDQTPQTVRKALSEMEDASHYDLLANEGFARTYMDWLYGVNLTRYATLKSGKLLRVGRVIVPIVKAIYDRDLAIRSFTPETYYSIASSAETKGEAIELMSKRKFTNKEYDKALACAELYQSLGATVKAVKRKKDKLSPPKLFSLSKLQSYLGKKYKMSMDQSLDIVQKLYEAGYLTYPRTNSEYLATAEKDKIKRVLAQVKELGYDVAFRDHKSIFDDKKIESHSALTPTYKIPEKGKLSEEEFCVYSTVLRRFVAVFCREECLIERTEIEIAVGEEETFTLRGNVILEKGWTRYEDRDGKDKILPQLAKGERVNTDFKPIERETAPPKHYTIETLNNYLKNPFREEKAQAEERKEEAPENDEEDYRAIFEGLELGTEATRTGIIENARKSDYIQLKKDVYTIRPEGEFLINFLSHMQISMDKYKTAELGKALKRVYRGEMPVADSVLLAEREIAAVFHPSELPPEEDREYGCIGDLVGACPLCGKEVRRTTFGYGCSGYKEGCRFSVNGVICDRVISVANMRLLLTEGRSSVIRGFVSKKTGKTFDAALIPDGNGVKFDFAPRAAAQRPASGGYYSSRYQENPVLPPDFFD